MAGRVSTITVNSMAIGWTSATRCKAYVAANGHVINRDPYQYFTMTESAEQELIKATNEMHLMYLHATDKVMRDDNLLALFDIPENPLAASASVMAAPSPRYDNRADGFLHG